MTNETSDPPPTQVQAAQANIAHDDDEDPTNVEGRIPQKIARREIARVVIKISGSQELLEIEGDDVDLGILQEAGSPGLDHLIFFVAEGYLDSHLVQFPAWAGVESCFLAVTDDHR